MFDRQFLPPLLASAAIDGSVAARPVSHLLSGARGSQVVEPLVKQPATDPPIRSDGSGSDGGDGPPHDRDRDRDRDGGSEPASRHEAAAAADPADLEAQADEILAAARSRRRHCRHRGHRSGRRCIEGSQRLRRVRKRTWTGHGPEPRRARHQVRPSRQVRGGQAGRLRAGPVRPRGRDAGRRSRAPPGDRRLPARSRRLVRVVRDPADPRLHPGRGPFTRHRGTRGSRGGPGHPGRHPRSPARTGPLAHGVGDSGAARNAGDEVPRAASGRLGGHDLARRARRTRRRRRLQHPRRQRPRPQRRRSGRGGRAARRHRLTRSPRSAG